MNPPVEKLVKIVEIVLRMAVALPFGSHSVVCSHTLSPAIVTTSGLQVSELGHQQTHNQYVAVVGCNKVAEDLGATLDIEGNVVAATCQPEEFSVLTRRPAPPSSLAAQSASGQLPCYRP